MTYADFLQSKIVHDRPTGFSEVPPLNPMLKPFQCEVVAWALQRGRAALFEDCGLGKTPQQLEWARCVYEHTGGDVLILAPLAVANQTLREAGKFGIAATVCETMADVKPGINITNYEKLHHFTPHFTGIVLDESSILKSFDGSTRKQICEFSKDIDYRLACTATPAPNDLIEITNHAEFLNIMSGKEIIALYFTQDGNTTHKWRLKGHAKQDFWRWLASWAVAMRKPSDLGYDDTDYILPGLNFHEHIVDSSAPDNMLFALEAQTLSERRGARKESLTRRVELAARLVGREGPAIVWCDYNDESEALARAIPDGVQVTGSDSPQTKTWALNAFSTGEIRVLISKSSICGFGMNWQHCNRVVFAGLSDSYEQYYQAIRRCWRFGQTQQVDVHLISSNAEGAVRSNIERKEREASLMFDNIIKHMNGLQLGKAARNTMVYETRIESGKDWKLMLGDCVERIDEINDDSIGLSVFSPPFPGMYAYTNSPRDIGNTRNIDEMMNHFEFLIPKLLRVTMPGRHAAVHLTQAVAFKGADGYIGIKDFRGRVIQAFERHGWIYYGETCIDKNPQVKAIRTRDSGLQFKSLATDSARMHMALADYILQFKKTGENPAPIRSGISEKYDNMDGWITAEEWILWARPIWYGDDLHHGLGIRETDVLNVACAREANDERHLCPLQLGVIERCVKLWSNPGETVFSPFTGIGSEGYQALKFGRRFIGIELKESYFKTACKNLTEAARLSTQHDLVSQMESA